MRVCGRANTSDQEKDGNNGQQAGSQGSQSGEGGKSGGDSAEEQAPLLPPAHLGLPSFWPLSLRCLFGPQAAVRPPLAAGRQAARSRLRLCPCLCCVR